MIDIPHDCYCFVVDTDSYTGNFEREMCAYMTGAVSGCKGEKCASSYIKKHKKQANVRFVPDDDGSFRPVNIFDRGNSKYESFIIFFGSERPSSKIIKRMKDRAYEFLTDTSVSGEFDKKPNEILGFRLLYSPPLKLENIDIND